MANLTNVNLANQPEKEVFKTLYAVNVNEHVEQKNTGKATLSYLSWAWAWAEIKQRYPGASYRIIKNENNLPFFYDPKVGIMCYTEVTIDSVTHEMWLPVMDGANNAMKFEPYEYQTKYGPKTVAAATMFDVNKTIMRCLTKNLAMFGLGLYIYGGEDLPQETEEDKIANEKLAVEISAIKLKIDKIVKEKTAEMSKDAKIAFANEQIKPIIGSLNYQLCNNKNALETLLNNLEA